MPGLNGTGPRGLGPLTGRGMGVCGTNGATNAYGYGRGLGYGRGFGCGRGFRGYGYNNNFTQNSQIPMNAENEKSLLQNQEEFLKSQLASIQKRLDEIE